MNLKERKTLLLKIKELQFEILNAKISNEPFKTIRGLQRKLDEYTNLKNKNR